MGERKVLNKYYPADFDPAKIPRRRRQAQMTVKMMLAMSIRCGTCGNYMYKGTKFNCRKEDVSGDGSSYLGIQIIRFYLKCSNCSAEIILATDPQNSDYVVESGASRNFEPWRRAEEEEADEKKRNAQEMMADAMKSLEKRSLHSKREMDIVAALHELKSMKSRRATVTVDAMLEALTKKNMEEEEEDEDEEVFQLRRGKTTRNRIDDEDLEFDTRPLKRNKVSSSNQGVNGRAASHHAKPLPIKFSIMKKKSAPNSNANKPEEEDAQSEAPTDVLLLQSLFQHYASDQD